MDAIRESSRTGSLSDHAYEWLLELISAPEWREGGRLPSEIALARQLKVSRPVLRQALTRLRSEGLIASRRGAGNFVQRRAGAEVLSYGPLQSIPDVQRCLEFRCGLESEAAAHAALLRDDAALRQIQGAAAAMEQAVAAGSPAVEMDFAFHLEIARATRNRFFIITLQALKPQILFSVNLIQSLSTRPPQQRLEAVRSEHGRIYDAIRDGDADRARQAMWSHMTAGIKRLFGE